MQVVSTSKGTTSQSVRAETTAVNNWRAYLYCIPQLLFAMLDNAIAAFVPFLTMYWRCVLNRSSLSNITPRYFASFDDSIVVFPMVIAAFVARL
jgi:hypothetical protein